MSDKFELILHSPLTKEDWNKLSDAEHENTMYVTFQTPQGRQVRYIKCEVFDKIITDLEALRETTEPHLVDYRYHRNDMLDMVLSVIERYRNEVST